MTEPFALLWLNSSHFIWSQVGSIMCLPCFISGFSVLVIRKLTNLQFNCIALYYACSMFTFMKYNWMQYNWMPYNKMQCNIIIEWFSTLGFSQSFQRSIFFDHQTDNLLWNYASIKLFKFSVRFFLFTFNLLSSGRLFPLRFFLFGFFYLGFFSIYISVNCFLYLFGYLFIP